MEVIAEQVCPAEAEKRREASRKQIVKDIRESVRIATARNEEHIKIAKEKRDKWNGLLENWLTRPKLNDLPFKIAGPVLPGEKSYVNQLRRNGTNAEDAAAILLMDRQLKIMKGK